jgi:hypothetical protein
MTGMHMRNLPSAFFLITFLSLCGCSGTGRAVIAFTGDIIMHIPVKSCAISHDKVGETTKVSLNNRGFDFLFEEIRNLLAGGDVVIGNMEFPVSPPYGSRPKIFNCNPEVIPALKKAGFTMLHIANNHIMDQGKKGIISSIEHIRNNNMDYLGVAYDERAARAGIVKVVNGIRVGFIGYTGQLNYPKPKIQDGYHLNWLYNRDAIKQDMEDMRKRCDYLVLIAHTGVEYASGPTLHDSEILKMCINQGADLIICHHSHLLQPAEKVIASDGRDCFIFYSLGNFISNQDAKPQAYVNGLPLTTRDSIIVRCILTRTASRGRPVARFEIIPIRTINIAGKGSRIIQTVSIARERENLKKRYTYADEVERVAIHRELQTLDRKSVAIKMSVLKNYNNGEIAFIE